MLDISRKLTDELIINDKIFLLNLTFSNVLKFFEMFRDIEVPDEVKPFLALKMLVGQDNFDEVMNSIAVEETMDLVEEIFIEHILLNGAKDISVEYDLAGNVMQSTEEAPKEKPVYNIEFDGEYIYASFMQAYGIDLFEVQDTLHWKKFNALLAGLPDGTKFVEVIKIRKYKPQKGESQAYISEMRKLQKEYALPDEEIEEEEEDYYS